MPSVMFRVKRFWSSRAYKSRISLFRLWRGARIDELRAAQKPVLVERGKEPSVLIIAFTGAGRMLMLPVYEFFETTKTLGYSRILLRDQYDQYYHRGIDDFRPDFYSLIAYLRAEIGWLRPKTVLCVGSSSGGYAAIRAGHLLCADYVHAFGPQTGKHQSGYHSLFETTPLDLSDILKNVNGKTTYYIHYCGGCENDRYHAERLSNSQGVITIGYPCDTHFVAISLAKKNFLTEALAIANQACLVDHARTHFPGGLEINECRRRQDATVAKTVLSRKT